MLPAVRRRVYRAWFQTAAATAVMLVFLLISVSIFTDEWSRDDLFSVILFPVIRGEFIPWCDVTVVSCEADSNVFGLRLHTPVVQLAAPSDDEAAVPVAAMASYRLTVARRRSEMLAALVPPPDAVSRT